MLNPLTLFVVLSQIQAWGMAKESKRGYRIVMSTIRNVCLIDTAHSVATAFKNLGYSVLALRTQGAPFFDVAASLRKENFEPDMMVQSENLGKRCVVLGVESLDCPTIFWAVDPHLNAYWHRRYSRRFDITCSTQRAWIPRLKAQGAEDVRWLPMFGNPSPWVDMKKRTHDLAFVGRITPQRPSRKWMVDLLRKKAHPHDLAVETQLAYREMMDLYRDTRIVPNESIFGEVNFRLFEAASCGCVVLDQNLGEEQAELFEPGREIDVYANVVEMEEKLSLYLGNDRLLQAMGRAALERVQAEHTPRHRVERMVDYARDAVRRRAVGPDGEKWLALSVATMWESGVLAIPAQDVLARLAEVEQDGDVAASTLRVQTLAGMNRVMADNLMTILGSALFATNGEINLVGSMAALHLEHFDAAKAFWYRHVEAAGLRNPGPPPDPKALLILWAKELKRQGAVVRAGFPFDPGVHLPAAAGECLMRILSKEPEDIPTLRLLDTMLRPEPGLEQARVGFLSVLTLHERDDWRLALEIALANLKSFRLDSGVEELHLARDIARKQGQEAVFDKVLAARDPSGRLAARLNS